MLFKFSIRQISLVNRKKQTHNLYRDLLNRDQKLSQSLKRYNLFVPGYFSTTLTKNFSLATYHIFLSNSQMFINIFVPSNYITLAFEKETNNMNITTIYSSNFLKIYWLSLYSISYGFSKVFYKKIKFKGKGYYVYKDYRNTIAPQFGYSHRIYIYS